MLLRQAQALPGWSTVKTVGSVIDLFLVAKEFPKASRHAAMYERGLRILRAGFGDEPVATLRPSIIREIVQGMDETPGAANNFLGAIRRSRHGRGA